MSRFLIVAVISLLAGFSFADTAATGDFIDAGLVPADVLELQDGGQSVDLSLDVDDSLTADSKFDRVDRERYERDCRRRGYCEQRPPRRAPPRRPLPPPRRPVPRPGYGYVCYAENEYREIFTGRDHYSARFAQSEALDACYAYSRRCIALGCDRY
jgi:hypothetical protein